MRLSANSFIDNFVQHRMSGEQSLAYAVLHRALRDLTGSMTSCESDDVLEIWRQKAIDWFLVDDVSGYTFTQVCEALGLDRQWALKLIKHKIREINGH